MKTYKFTIHVKGGDVFFKQEQHTTVAMAHSSLRCFIKKGVTVLSSIGNKFIRVAPHYINYIEMEAVHDG